MSSLPATRMKSVSILVPDESPTASAAVSLGGAATKQQLAALTAVPAALANMGGQRKRVKNKKGRLASEQHKAVLGNIFPKRIRASARQTFHWVSQYANGALLTTSTAGPTYASVNFQLSQFADYGVLTPLFDQYRLADIEVILAPQATEGSVAGGFLSQLLASAIDIDSASNPTSFAQVEGYPSAIVTGPYSAHYHRWKPSFAVAVYAGAFTSYGSSMGWVDCSSPNVQWYGLMIAAGTASTAQVYSLFVRARFEFLAVHGS